MKFEDNEIIYGQGCSHHFGIPANIDFKVKLIRDDPLYKLTACGYGCFEHEDCYGHGAIFLYGNAVLPEIHQNIINEIEAKHGEGV